MSLCIEMEKIKGFLLSNLTPKSKARPLLLYIYKQEQSPQSYQDFP